MRAVNLEGTEVELKKEWLDNFRMQLKGPVILPGEPGYDESRLLWNGMFDRRPAVVVKCIGTADIIASVKFARENNLLICVKGGGHNIGGLAASDGAVLLDLSLMRGVWVDREKKIAHAQAGCLLGDVDRETQLYGLAAVLGFVSQTGIAGLTLGGGFGYLTRRFGWTCDNLSGIDVVSADGKLLRASDNENKDLYWALRGGGGNFGVAASIDFKLYPVGPEITGGVTAWPVENAKEVLDLYVSLAEKAPEELTLVALIRPAPPAPWVPVEWHGKLIAAILACWSGSKEEGEKILSPIRSLGKSIGNNLDRRPYVQLQSMLDIANPKGRRYYWKSEYLSDIKPGLVEKFIEYGKNIVSPFSAVIFFQLGGTLNKLSEDYSPMGNRDTRYVFNIASSWEKPSDDELNINWTRSAYNSMKGFSTGKTYINFLTQDEGPERIKDALGGSLKKLTELKAKWDPDNFFRTNRNIEPAKISV